MRGKTLPIIAGIMIAHNGCRYFKSCFFIAFIEICMIFTDIYCTLNELDYAIIIVVLSACIANNYVAMISTFLVFT